MFHIESSASPPSHVYSLSSKDFCPCVCITGSSEPGKLSSSSSTEPAESQAFQKGCQTGK